MSYIPFPSSLSCLYFCSADYYYYYYIHTYIYMAFYGHIMFM